MQNSENKEVINIMFLRRKDLSQKINQNYVMYVKCRDILQEIANSA